MSLSGCNLFYFDHLAELPITYKNLIHFFNFLLEYKVFITIHDIDHIRINETFPHPLVERIVNPLPCILIKTLKISLINIDSLSINTAKTQILLYLIGNILPISYFLGFFLSLAHISIHIATDQILLEQEETELWADLLEFWYFQGLLLEQEYWGLSHFDVRFADFYGC